MDIKILKYPFTLNTLYLIFILSARSYVFFLKSYHIRDVFSCYLVKHT